MAVVVSDNANTSYDGNLSTVNGFYRAEASNLGIFGAGSATNLKKYIAFTPANAGNMLAVMLMVIPGTKDMTVALEKNTGTWGEVATKTLTSAQMTAGGVTGGKGQFVTFYLTTPYAITTDASTWRISIVDSGTGTGHVALTSDGTNISYALWCDNKVSYTTNQDQLIVYSTTYIDGTYTFKGAFGTGDTTRSVNCWIGMGTDLTPDNVAKLQWKNPATAAWTLTLDGYCVGGSYSGFRAGTATNPIGNGDLTKKGKIVVKRTPTLGTAGYSGFNTPTQSTYQDRRFSFFIYGAKPTYNQTTSTYNTIVGGTATMTIASPCVVTKSSHGLRDGYPAPIQFTTTGALPTGLSPSTTYWAKYINTTTFNLYPTYADAMAGTNIINTSGTQSGTHTIWAVIITADDVSAEWGAGHYIGLGRAIAVGATNSETTTNQTIGSISGTTIVMGTHLGYAHQGGAKLFRIGEDYYGMSYQSDTTTAVMSYLGCCNNFVLSGCYVYFNSLGGGNVYASLETTTTYRSQHLVEDSCFVFASAQPLVNWSSNESGLLVDNNIFWNACIGAFGGGNTATNGISAAMTFSDNFLNKTGTQGNFAATSPVATLSGNHIDNTIAQPLNFAGYGHQILSNSFWSSAAGNPFYYMAGTVGMRSTGNLYNYSQFGCIGTNGIVVDFISTNDSFGQLYANTYDFYVGSYYTEITIKSPTGTPGITGYASMISGSFVAIEDNNDVSNVDLVYEPKLLIQRTGTSLTDTTVRTAGGYAMRFQPLSSTVAGTWSFDVATGNIQNQATNIGVWVYINNAAYYANTHQMPRITVDYDNGTTTYGEAAQIAGDWQYVHAVFTPTTTYGQVTVTLSGMTDATSTNAYLYWDDFSGGFLVNTGLDSWSNGLPVPPAYSFNVNAATFWDYGTANATAAGSMGKLVVTTEKKVDDTTALIIGS